MACLIIGIIWICLRFIGGLFTKIFDYTPSWSVFGFIMWMLGWFGNIALLIIGACLV